MALGGAVAIAVEARCSQLAMLKKKAPRCAMGKDKDSRYRFKDVDPSLNE